MRYIPLVFHPPTMASAQPHIVEKGSAPPEGQIVGIAERKDVRNIKRGKAPLQPRLIGILQAAEAAQPCHVVVRLGGVINRLRPGVGREELQSVIRGISNQSQIIGCAGELRKRRLQLVLLRRRCRQPTVGVADGPIILRREWIVDEGQ